MVECCLPPWLRELEQLPSPPWFRWAIHSQQLAVVRVDCPLGPVAAVQASPPPPCVQSQPHAKRSIKTVNSPQSTPADTPASSGDAYRLINRLPVMPRRPQNLVAPTPAPLAPLALLAPRAPERLRELAQRQDMDDENCTCALLSSSGFQRLIIEIFAL